MGFLKELMSVPQASNLIRLISILSAVVISLLLIVIGMQLAGAYKWLSGIVLALAISALIGGFAYIYRTNKSFIAENSADTLNTAILEPKTAVVGKFELSKITSALNEVQSKVNDAQKLASTVQSNVNIAQQQYAKVSEAVNTVKNNLPNK